jgi:hypothetical protein
VIEMIRWRREKKPPYEVKPEYPKFSNWAGGIAWPASVSEKAKRVFFKLMKESPTLRKKAMRSLKKMELNEEKAADLLEAVYGINDLSSETKSMLLNHLALKTGKKAIPSLKKYYKQDRAFQYKETVRDTLAMLGDKASISHLVQLLSSKYKQRELLPNEGLHYAIALINTALSIVPKKQRARLERAQKFFKSLGNEGKESLLLLYLALNPQELERVPPNFSDARHRKNIDYFVSLRHGAQEHEIKEMVEVLKLSRYDLLK